MRLSTLSTLPGEQVQATLGLVHETAVVSVDAARDVFAAVKNFVGGKVGNYEKLATKARIRALEMAVTSARDLGANAILGCHIDVDFSAQEKGGFCFVTFTGTAVVSQPAPAAPSPI